MKKVIALLTATVLVVMFAACGEKTEEDSGDSSASETEELTITEEEVAQTEAEVEDEGDFSNKGITDEMLVEMIESGKIPSDITSLKLNNNEISDISPLVVLTELIELNLDFNFISDLTPIAELTNICYLFLAQNEISDVSPLLELLEMQRLNLTGNDVDEDDIRELLEVLQCEILS
ncbi:MAG: hypothetical protein FWF94_07225 [Oscillospiraceae bacterium]|nr:hypothetical protein [Oscillospiraceae bacterium]